MPELPEVETVRLGLQPVLEGARLLRVEQRRPDLRIPFPVGFSAALTGRRVTLLKRRAKYLLMETAGAPTVLMHLGMSGRFHIVTEETGGAAAQMALPASLNPRHEHVVLETERGRVSFFDHRRFGLMTFVDPAEPDSHPLLAGLGPEPLDDAFTPARLQAALAGRNTPLKVALLDQRVVAGLGNIYVCEALHRARLSPRRKARSVGAGRAVRLTAAIKEVLTEAIAAGGSSLRDYAHADGSLGYFQHGFAVYGRHGAPCPRPGCGTVQRLVQSGRSTFFCACCQR